jgi:hypothetical protein
VLDQQRSTPSRKAAPSPHGRRFSAEDVEVIRDLVAQGHGAGFIAMRLDKEPGAVRSKLSAMGLPIRPRAKPTYGSRFQISADIWSRVETAATKRSMTATKLGHVTLARIAKLDLWDCVLDAPAVERQPEPVRSALVPFVAAFNPVLDGRVNSVELAGSN